MGTNQNKNNFLSLTWPLKLCVFLPLLFLANDLRLFPFVFHTYRSENKVIWQQLADSRRVHLGRYNGHGVFIVLDDISNTESFNFMSPGKTAIVVSHFLGGDGVSSRTGSVSREIKKRLDRHSSSQATAFMEFLRKTPPFVEGDILEFQVKAESELQNDFLISHIFILLFNEDGTQAENIKSIKTGFKKIFDSASQKKIKNLIIPALTVDPRHPDNLQLGSFYSAVSDVTPVGIYPKQIYVTLYSELSTRFIANAIDSGRPEWNKRLTGKIGISVRLFNSEFRMVMILLSLCLFISTFITKFSFRNALIISISFIAFATGATAAVNSLFSQYRPDIMLLFSISVKCVVAVFLSSIIYWDPRDIFGK